MSSTVSRPLAAPKAASRVLFFSYHLPRDEEPGAFRPWMEARLLQAAGFEVTVISSGVHYMTGQDTRKSRGWCTEEWAGGIRILKTWGPTDFRRSTWGRLWHYLAFSCLSGLAALTRVGRVDRVFAGTDPIFIMPVVFLVSQLKRAPLILDERDLYPETAIALGIMRPGWLATFFFQLQQFFRKKAYGILAATPGIRDKLREYGFGEKVQLLYNADVFLTAGPGRNAPEASLRQQTGKKFLVGYAGGLGQANDVWTILRAARRLRDDCPDLGFVIIGTGENLGAYQEYCQQQRLENVFFVGARPRSKTRELIKEIDICLHAYPSHKYFSDALSSKIFDYQGLGKPVIFSGRGDTAKLLAASGGGLSLPPEDDRALAAAILQLWQDENRRRTMAAAAQRWFAQHVSVAAATQIIKKVMGYGTA